MGWINRLCIRQLRKTERLIEARIALAVTAADTGLAAWELQAQHLRERLAEIRNRIAAREATEATRA